MSEVFFLQPLQEISWVLGKPLTLGPRRYWDIYLSMSPLYGRSGSVSRSVVSYSLRPQG